MVSPAQYAWLLIALYAAAFVVVGLGRRWLPGQGVWLSILASFLAWALGMAIVVESITVFVILGAEGLATSFRVPWLTLGAYRIDLGMTIDTLSTVMIGVVTTCAFLIQVYSAAYLADDDRRGWFFAVLSLFTAAMLGLVLSSGFFFLFVSWELVGLCSYLLIGFWYDRRPAAEAAKKAFVTTRIGDVGLFIGIMLLLVTVGSLEYEAVFRAVGAGQIAAGLLAFIGVMLFLGAMGKSGQVPLHVWLPDAMEGPTPVSALIHAATMVTAGVYLVARAYPVFAATPGVLLLILVVGSITSILASLVALVQTDIKRIIAYSTVGELGLMMMALGVGGYSAAIFHLTTHAFFKALLFLGAGSVIHAVHTQDIFEMGGLRRAMPITFITFLLAAASLAGFPFFSGFFSKDEIAVAALENGHLVPFMIILLTAFLKAFSIFRLVFVVFFDRSATAMDRERHAGHGVHEADATHQTEEGHRAPPPHHVHEAPWLMVFPLIVLAVPAGLLGFIGSPFFGGAFGRFLYYDHPHAAAFHPEVFIPAVVLSLGGIALAASMYLRHNPAPAAIRHQFSPLTALFEEKFFFDRAYQWLIDRVVLVFSGLVAWLDKRAIDQTGVDGPAELTNLAGEGLRYHQSGFVSNYLLIFAGGAAILFIGIYLMLVIR